MKINKERIKNIIETFATYNDSPDNGISRFSYSETDCKAREYLIGLCTEIGLKVRVDSIGNIFARLEGSNPNLPIVMSGSHIDSVKNGGRYDGIVGVVGALEAIKVMAKSTSNSTVATVGNIDVNPNIPNAIPGKVSFIVDIRDVNQNSIDGVVELIKMATAKYSKENNVDFDISKLASTDTIKIQQYLIDIMEKNAKSLNIDYILMPSGAVHDSNYMAEVTDVGMIFVPSKGGRSHVKA